MRIAAVFVACVVVGCVAPSGPYVVRTDPAIARMCSDPRAAYEAGYNGGMGRAPIDSAWIDTYCAPQGREPLRQAYVAGYQAGTQVAPQYPAYPQPLVYAPAYPACVGVGVGVGVGGYGYARPVAPAAAGRASTCELNSDGTHTCGFNCHLGSDGHHYCASTPAGQCALESSGGWACP